MYIHINCSQLWNFANNTEFHVLLQTYSIQHLEQWQIHIKCLTNICLVSDWIITFCVETQPGYIFKDT